VTFDDYQKTAITTALVNDDPLINKTIYAMGIAGEAGEVIEKWKKIVAYKNGVIDKNDLAELAKEVGDVIWYCAVFADSLGLSLEKIMKNNVEKLADRHKRGVIKGVGDNR